MRSRPSVDEIGTAFAARYGGAVERVRAHGTGHIHDTFALTWRRGGEACELLVQRFNTDVFSDPEVVMRNIARVTEHLRAKLVAAGASDIARRVLRIVPAPDGALWVRASELAGAPALRVFEYIGDTIAYDNVQSSEQPFQAGRAFGAFAAMLADLPPPPLVETIPGFHDTEARLAALRSAYDLDPHGRGRQLAAERERIEAHADLAGYCARAHASGSLPLQVTHNDAKLSNLLFDARSGEALCVVDLDTVMPGYPAYDFGDLVRTTACIVAEDARDPSTMQIRMDYVEALARGYLEPAGGRISDAESDALATGPRILCLELGMRFLTDHILGDHYFPIQRPGHNLDRARVQFTLLEALTDRANELRECLERARKK